MRVRFTLGAAVLCSLAFAGGAPAAPTWLAPVDLSASETDYPIPVVALDGQGDALTAWEHGTHEAHSVQSAARTAGGAWQAPVTLSRGTDDTGGVQIAVGASGEALAVWHDVKPDRLSASIMVATRAADGSWQEPVEISSPGHVNAGPQVAVDPQGDAMVVWMQADRGSDGSFTAATAAATRPAGGSWQAPVVVSGSGTKEVSPQIAVSSQGDAIATWIHQDNGNTGVRAAMLPSGGSWQQPGILSTPAPDAGENHAAFDAQGNATVIWVRSQNGTDYTVQARTRSADGTWQPVTALSTTYGHSYPRLAVDPAGDAIAVWSFTTDDSDTSSFPQAAVRPAGGTWEAPVNLGPAENTNDNPDVAIDPHGNAVAVWCGPATSGSHCVAHASERPAGGSWRPPVDLSAATVDAVGTRVAIDPQGEALAVWRAESGTSGTIQAAAYDTAGPVLSSLSVPDAGTVGEVMSSGVSALDVWSALGPLHWDFGDGSSADGAAVTHVYGAAGTYQVTLTATDAVGNATTTQRTVAITAAPIAPSSTPTISGARQTHARWRVGGRLAALARVRRIPVGTRFSYRLDQAATVGFAFTRSIKQRHHKRRWVKAGALRVSGRIGANALRFQGRLSAKKRLRPGRYRVTITAVNGTGQRSKPVRLVFTIVRPRR